MKYTQTRLKELQHRYIKDFGLGLLTKQQLLTMIYRLDRMSHFCDSP